MDTQKRATNNPKNPITEEKEYLITMDMAKELSMVENNMAMTSLEVAEITGKEHKNILRDISDESNKLGHEVAQLIFELSEYKDSWRGNLRKHIC